MSVNPSRVVSRYLSAATSRLTPKIKSLATAGLIKAGLDGNGRFRSPGAALARAGDVLSTQGLEWGEVIHSFPFKQPEGRLNIRLALSNPDDPFSPTDISNSVLAFQWYKLDDDKYEIVAYLS